MSTSGTGAGSTYGRFPGSVAAAALSNARLADADFVGSGGRSAATGSPAEYSGARNGGGGSSSGLISNPASVIGGDEEDDDEDNGDGDGGEHEDDDEGEERGGGSGGKRGKRGSLSSSKRQRVHFSCTECHRRKQKCNRQTPCQHCIARKIPERCKTFQPGEDPNDLGARVARLEQVMQDNFGKVFCLLRPVAGPAIRERENVRHLGHQQAKSDRRFSSNGPSEDASTFTGAQTRDVFADGGEEVTDRERFYPDQFTNPAPASSMKIDSLLDSLSGTNQAVITDPVRSIQSGTALDAVMFEYGASDSTSQALLAALPPKELADVLFEHFVHDIAWLRQPIPPRSLKSKYDALWGSGPTLTASNINIYALLMIIMAMAMLSVERPGMVPDDPRAIRLTARRLHYAGMRALLVSTMLGREDLDQVMAFALSGRFLVLDRRIIEAWTCVANAVKAGHSIGLHRDGSKLRLPPAEAEERRRTWCILYFSERMLCMNLTRPTAIDESVCDVEAPSEDVNDVLLPDYMKSSSPPQLPPGVDRPTLMTYSKHRHRLAVIMSRIVSAYQALDRPAHYADIVSIDRELLDFQESLPSYLQARITEDGRVDKDSSLDEAFSYIPVHRYLLCTEVMFVRCALHRPYLLRSSGKQGERYMYSRKACVEAAHHDILLRQDFITDMRAKFGEGCVPLSYSTHIGIAKWFNALLICSIYVLMDPHADDAPTMQGHLERFLAIPHQKRLRHERRDEMKERERQIIQLFWNRIEELRKKEAVNQDSSRDPRKIKTGSNESVKRAATEDHSVAKRPKKRSSGLNGKASTTTSSSTDEDGDAHATAGLLLGLQRQKVGGGEGNGSSIASPLAPSSNLRQFSGELSPKSLQSLPSRLQQQGQGPGSSSSAQDASPGVATNSSSDDAQAIFDAWYTAEFIAGGSVLDAAFGQHPPSFSGNPGNAAANMGEGTTGVGSSDPKTAQHVPVNAFEMMDYANPNNAISSTPAAMSPDTSGLAGGLPSSTSEGTSTGPALSTNPYASAAAPSSLGMPSWPDSLAASSLGTLPSSALASSLPGLISMQSSSGYTAASAPAGQQGIPSVNDATSIDSNFWQHLINKISG